MTYPQRYSADIHAALTALGGLLTPEFMAESSPLVTNDLTRAYGQLSILMARCEGWISD